MKNTVAATDFYWTIDGTGKLYFLPKSAATNHDIIFGRGGDIEALEIEENTESVVNDYFLKYNSGTVNSQDATSQTANGVRQKKTDSTDIQDVTSAQNAADDFITQNKNYKKRVVITINNKYDFESIKAGDKITVKNTTLDINALQIKRLDYNKNQMRVELEKIRSFSSSILNT